MRRKKFVSMLLVATLPDVAMIVAKKVALEVRKSLMHSLLYRDLKSMMIMKSRRSSRKRQV